MLQSNAAAIMDTGAYMMAIVAAKEKRFFEKDPSSAM